MTEHQLVKSFAFNLKSIMDELEVTPSILSSRTGINRSTISRYLNRETIPSVKNLINIAIVLDCELNDLVDDSEMIE